MSQFQVGDAVAFDNGREGGLLYGVVTRLTETKVVVLFEACAWWPHPWQTAIPSNNQRLLAKRRSQGVLL